MSVANIAVNTATGAMGAEEEAKSIFATVLAQIVTLFRNIVNYMLEYSRLIIVWMAKNPFDAIRLGLTVAILASP
jgi:hypothetical protein